MPDICTRVNHMREAVEEAAQNFADALMTNLERIKDQAEGYIADAVSEAATEVDVSGEVEYQISNCDFVDGDAVREIIDDVVDDRFIWDQIEEKVYEVLDEKLDELDLGAVLAKKLDPKVYEFVEVKERLVEESQDRISTLERQLAEITGELERLREAQVPTTGSGAIDADPRGEEVSVGATQGGNSDQDNG